MSTSVSDIDTALDLKDLSELMASVSEVTARLQTTHDAVQEQVAQLKAELASANAKLRRSQELAALGEMAAGIAHEIRNPLGSIQLYAQMLADDLSSQPDKSELCQRIEAAVQRLNAIVGDVLTFAREMRIRPRRIAAADLVQQAVQSCSGLVCGRRIELRTDVPQEIHITADPGLMGQAIGNLVRNAIEAMTEHQVDRPRVEITAGRQTARRADGHREERLVIRVDDNGPGVPPEIISRIFNPFFTTRPEGTGLGLSIVHRIVDAHDGELELRNRQGGGARAEIWLPFDQPPTGSGENVRSRTMRLPDIEVEDLTPPGSPIAVECDWGPHPPRCSVDPPELIERRAKEQPRSRYEHHTRH